MFVLPMLRRRANEKVDTVFFECDLSISLLDREARGDREQTPIASPDCQAAEAG
jgi:hypothetical protein